jgi:adenylosuccinate lyase
MTDVIDRLLVYPENMMANLRRTHGITFSQSVLLALTNAGMSREEAYRLVQGAAMQSWQTGRELLEILKESPAVTAVVKPAELESQFDLKKSLRHVDHIFQRAGLA